MEVTPMIDDEKIIALFWARSEEAIQELDSKYGKICNKLSYNILSDTSRLIRSAPDSMVKVRAFYKCS